VAAFERVFGIGTQNKMGQRFFPPPTRVVIASAPKAVIGEGRRRRAEAPGEGPESTEGHRGPGAGRSRNRGKERGGGARGGDGKGGRGSHGGGGGNPRRRQTGILLPSLCVPRELGP